MMRPGDILFLELDKDTKGKAKVLFLAKAVNIRGTEIEIEYWVCKLISGNVPNNYYQALPQQGNRVHLMQLLKRVPGKPPPVLRVLHKEDEIDQQQCSKCKGLGFEDRETNKSPGITDTFRCSCSKCRGSGWIGRT